MMGAAIASTLSYLLLAITGYFISRRFYPITYEWGRTGKIFLAAALVYIGSLLILNDSVLIALILKLLVLLGFPLLLLIFRFFRLEEISKVKEIILRRKYVQS
jgi:hypothetical protein